MLSLLTCILLMFFVRYLWILFSFGLCHLLICTVGRATHADYSSNFN
jgi:hypothetical protein